MANYVNLTKKTFNPYNPKVLNEGQFSWITQDSDEQIGSERENTIDVWMYDNEGNSWYENRYEGYGVFGGMDYYELLAKMNGYTEEDLKGRQEMRNLGIDLAFKKLKTKDKGKKVLFPALVADGKYNWKRHDFTQEAESDPNQSWYQEPEYDDYEDDYYESEQVTEGQVLLFDELNDKFDVLATSISELMDKTEDPKWTKALGGLMNQLEKLIDTAAKHDTKLGAIETNESEELTWEGLKESLGLNEGRSINKISKDHAATVIAMANTAKEWKESEGDRKTELLDKLRVLNKQKADLEKELDDAVAGKDKNLQLSLEEAENLAYLEKDLASIFESEGIVNEYSTSNFNPEKISRKDEIDSGFFKKLMPRTSKTIKEATKHIESWAGGTMFTHVQYFIVRPNGNAEDRPTYRIHNDQYWLNDTQLGWAGRSGEKVNVTRLSIYDISEGEDNETFLGRAYVNTEVYLKEHRVVFEEVKRVS